MADLGITTANNFLLRSDQQAPRQRLRLLDAPSGVALPRTTTNIPGLPKSLIKALMVQLAHLETGNDPTYEQNDRYGKYAVHKNTLINYGYLSADGSSWEGLAGTTTGSNFKSSPGLQDRIMERFLQEQYKTCIKVGAIKDNDTPTVVAGILAVAYQFQDFTFSSQQYTLNYLINTTGNLTSYLGNILTYQNFSNLAYRYYEESGIASITTQLLQDNRITNNSNLNEKKLFSILEDINNSSVATVNLVETALLSNIEGQAKQRALTSASQSITNLDNKLVNIYTNLPAIKAKEWRETAKINDTLGRPGALFYNSGRYAVDTLNAG